MGFTQLVDTSDNLRRCVDREMSSTLTDYPPEMLAFSQKGDNASVDMLVGDIYGQDYSRLGLKSTTIASSFGKVFKHGGVDKGKFKPEDISKSLLYAVSNNIGQIAYVWTPRRWSMC